MTKRIQATNSFTASEVDALASLLTTLQRGGDAKVIVRAKSFQSVRAKVESMRKRIDTLKAAKADAAE